MNAQPPIKPPVNRRPESNLFSDAAPEASPSTTAVVEPAPTSTPPPVQPDPKAVALVEMLAAASKPAPEPNDDMDWSSANPNIVVPCQPMTAVYENPYGAIVIRQEAPYPDDDPYILIRPEYVSVLIARLQTFLPQKPAGGRR